MLDPEASLSLRHYDVASDLSFGPDLIELSLPLCEIFPSSNIFIAFWHDVGPARSGITTMAQPAL